MAGAGYEDQVPDPDAEARFQQFINEPGSRGSQLRDAFAQLIAQGQTGAVPAEALWARQGLDQLSGTNPAAPNTDRSVQAFGAPGTVLPQQRMLSDPNLNFPTAPAGPGSPEQTPAPRPDPLPFPGAKDITIKPYGLPETPKKKSKKKGKD